MLTLGIATTDNEPEMAFFQKWRNFSDQVQLVWEPALGTHMDRKELYTEAFMLAWEHIEETDNFTKDERDSNYEPLKTKIYEFMEAGQTEPLALATSALAWLRDHAQINRSAERVFQLGKAQNSVRTQ